MIQGYPIRDTHTHTHLRLQQTTLYCLKGGGVMSLCWTLQQGEIYEVQGAPPPRPSHDWSHHSLLYPLMGASQPPAAPSQPDCSDKAKGLKTGSLKASSTIQKQKSPVYLAIADILDLSSLRFKQTSEWFQPTFPSEVGRRFFFSLCIWEEMPPHKHFNI